MADTHLEAEGNSDDTLEDIGNQLSAYERQLRKHLRNLDAKIDSYHFTIQKEGDGITIDLALRTTIRPKQKVDT